MAQLGKNRLVEGGDVWSVVPVQFDANECFIHLGGDGRLFELIFDCRVFGACPMGDEQQNGFVVLLCRF